MMGFFSLRHRV